MEKLHEPLCFLYSILKKNDLLGKYFKGENSIKRGLQGDTFVTRWTRRYITCVTLESVPFIAPKILTPSLLFLAPKIFTSLKNRFHRSSRQSSELLPD